MALQTWGTNLQMVVLPTLQSYCSEVYVSSVDKCLKVTASLKATSSGFLKLVIDFLRWGGGGGVCVCDSFFNQIKKCWFHPGKGSVARYVVINSSKSVL